MLKTYSTRGLPLQSGISFIQSVAEQHFGNSFLWSSLMRGDFAVDLSLRTTGEIMIARNKSSGFSQINDPTHGRHSRRRFAIHAAVDGPQSLVVDGETISLQRGQFTLLDTSLACSREQVAPSDTISLTVSEEMMRREVPQFGRLLHRSFASDDHLCRMIFDLLRQTTEVGDYQHSDSAAWSISGTVLNLLGLLATSQDCEVEHSQSRARTVRIAEIYRYIDQHLTDPELSLEEIARAIGLSTRYLHMLFAEEPMSIPKYVRTRRLAKAAERLRSPQFSSCSITEIVFDCGFNDLSHFCRLFRDHYGLTARDYRVNTHQ